MKEKAFQSRNEKSFSMFFSLLLAIAVVAVSFVCMSARAYAADVSIQNITWGTGDNDKVLSWDPVDGAAWYEVSIIGSASTWISSYDCKRLINKTGTFTPRVRAYNGDSVVIAETYGPEKYFEVPQLAKPSNIRIENGVVIWDAVPNADSYRAYMYEISYSGSYHSVGYCYIETNKIRLKTLAGWLAEGETYAVGIKACSSEGYGDSEEEIYNFVFQGYPVNTITNITWGTGENDKVLTWDSVEGAIRYLVEMNSSGGVSDTPSIDCKSFIRSEGTYVPKIKAYDANNEVIADAIGPEKYFTMPQLATPGNIKIENNMIIWDAVSNASEYRVSLYRHDEEYNYNYFVNHFYADEETSMPLSRYAVEDGKTYFATVIARDLGFDFGESEPGKSEYFVYEKTFAVNTAVIGEGGTISASAVVKNHENYVVTLKPKKGYVVDYLKVNGVDVTAEIVSNKYTISDITSDQTVEAGFSTCRHNWVAGAVTEATCKDAGEQTYTCSVCGDTKTESIPKLTTHTWNAGEVYVEPTCGATGLFRYTCKVCELTKDEILGKTNNHTYGKYVVTTESTCGNTGIKTRTCTVCGHDEEALVSATGKHSFSSATHKCTVCGLPDPSYVPLPEITKQPANVSVNDGTTAKFSVTATGAKTYQWQYSKDNGKTWTNSTVTSAKTATLSFTAKESFSGRWYRCVITNSEGKVNSKTATLTVKAKPAITTQPVNTDVNDGVSAKFSIVATGAETYQWQYSKDGGVTWINSTVTSAKTANLSFVAKASYSGRLYRCVVTNDLGTVNSNTATLTVKAVVSKPVITTQPVDVTVATGKTVKFTVAATGEDLTYQWKVSKDGGSTWANSTITSAKTATLSFSATASYSGRMYRCVVTNASGSVTTKDVTLTVKAAAAKPVITTQPTDVTVATGKTAKFSVATTGEGLTYQWKVSKDGGNTWTNSTVSSAKTATLSFTASASYSGRMYRCVVTNASGSVTTKDVTLTVGAKPIITAQPANATAVNGKNVKFSVTATGAESYQWQVSTDGGTTWTDSAATSAKTATLSFTAKTSYNGRLYRCVISNEAGIVNSNTAILTVN